MSEFDKFAISVYYRITRKDVNMQLVIAEKPSVARSIAQVIGAKSSKDGYMEGNGYIVSWCLGHLVELATPDTYDESYKSWRYDTLPIIPEDWKYFAKKDTAAQFKVLKGLMERSDVTELVCATDAGREGELIFRLTYNQAKCKKPFKRLWISSMEESAIKDGFAHLKPGTDYDGLYQSALCRQQADWLVGINGTRLFTVIYKSRNVLKVGRVQTPTLAMLVDRENEIRNFVKKPFFTTHLLAKDIDAVSERFDEKQKADDLAAKCSGKDAVAKNVKAENKTTQPPKLYDLTTLQRDANRIFSLTAKQTLDATQSLYEKKLCTYPRTDSQYLSDDMEDTAKAVLAVVNKILPFVTSAAGANIKPLLNSKKVTDHHAIIPTVEVGKADLGSLHEIERKVLALIAYRLVCAVGEKHKYKSISADMLCEGYTFKAKGRSVLDEGWKKYEKAFRQLFSKAGSKDKEDEDDEEEKAMTEPKEGETYPNCATKVAEGSTQPPKHFTEDSLLSAMERAGADDMEDDVERKGLGTPATRADIIEKLVHDGFVVREKKALIPTENGINLIGILPDEVKSPKLTADWENALSQVAKSEFSPEVFMKGIRKMVSTLVTTHNEADKDKQGMFNGASTLGKCPKCGEPVLKGKYGAYCKGKCGMILGKAFGKDLNDKQIQDLLAGKKILVKGLKKKDGSRTYDAYLVPDGIAPFSYKKKDGTEVSGYQFKYNMEFPQRKQKK